MSNFLYSHAKQLILNGDIDFSQDTIKALIVNSNYTVNQSAHQYKSDIASSCIEATSSNFQNRSTSSGIFDASDLIISDYNGNSFNYYYSF